MADNKSKRHPKWPLGELLFLAVVLNTISILPMTILKGGMFPFLPSWQEFLGNIDSATGLISYLFIYRESIDLLRVSADLVFVFLMLGVLSQLPIRRTMAMVATLVFLLVLVFNCYYWSYNHFFHAVSILDDLGQIGLLLDLVLFDFDFKMAMTGIGILATIVLLYWIFNRVIKCYRDLYQTAAAARGIHILVVTGMLIYFAVSFYLQNKYEKLYQSGSVVQFSSAYLYENIQSSVHSHDYDQLARQIRSINREHNIEFDKKRPNLFLIFIESYGDIAVADHRYAKVVIPELHKSEKLLRENGWHIASALSRSPVIGGRSWLAYSSFLFGFKVDRSRTHIQMQRMNDIGEYPSITKIARDNGYKNFRLSSLYADSATVPYAYLSRLYGIDEWIKQEDLNYTGPLIGFGPSPPDQYSINYATEKIRQESKQPFTLFFITQNSHTPFHGDIVIDSDWRKLSDNTSRDQIITNTNFFNLGTGRQYRRAIKYQLAYLSDFIVHQGTDDDIFLLIGDHQPPYLTPEKPSWKTPVHIISKDKAFISGFSEYSFNSGMPVEIGSSTVTHQGLYHILLREMVRQYSSRSPVPPYHQNGFDLVRLLKQRQGDTHEKLIPTISILLLEDQ